MTKRLLAGAVLALVLLSAVDFASVVLSLLDGFATLAVAGLVLVLHWRQAGRLEAVTRERDALREKLTTLQQTISPAWSSPLPEAAPVSNSNARPRRGGLFGGAAN